MTKPQLAKDIICYCTSCKMDLVHTITAMDGERIRRVLCRSCKKEHAFRLPPDLRSPGKRNTSRKAGPAKVSSSLHEWETEMERLRDLRPKRYTLDGHFETGEKVDHPTFGMGVVKRTFSSDKMDVLFQGGIKLLVRATTRPSK